MTITDPFKDMPDQRRYGSKYYSHSGADLLVLNILELLNIHTTATYLDLGAHHPTVISNTALLYERRLRGVNVEPNPYLFQNFRVERPLDLNLNVGVSTKSGEEEFYFIDNWSGRNTFHEQTARDFVRDNPQFRIVKVEKLPVLSLNDLIDQYCDSKFPDFLSIDIEQRDFDVLKSANFNESHPRIICAETIHSDGTQNYEVFRDMMWNQNFVTYCRLIADTIFVHLSDVGALGIPTY